MQARQCVRSSLQAAPTAAGRCGRRRLAAHIYTRLHEQGVYSSQELLSAVLEQHLAEKTHIPAVSSCTQSESLLNEIYEVLDEQIFFSKGGFVIPNVEKTRIEFTGGSASYGEVQAAGIDQLIR